jgi:hypothetical protein
MAEAQAIYDMYQAISGMTIPGGATVPYDPNDIIGLLNIIAPPTAPGVPTSDEQSIAAVNAAAEAASAQAQEAAAEQSIAGAASAEEIAAAKGKTAGTGAQNIAIGIQEEADLNLQNLLNQILGVQSQAQIDVTELAAGNQQMLDEFAVAIAETIAQNAGVYDATVQQAGQNATDVLNTYMGMFEPYNEQLMALQGQQDAGLAALMNAWNTGDWMTPTEGTPGQSEPDPFSESLETWLSTAGLWGAPISGEEMYAYMQDYGTLPAAWQPYYDELDAYYNFVPTEGTPGWQSPDYDAEVLANLEAGLSSLDLPPLPSAQDIAGQVEYDQPTYSAFPDIPGMESADLTPYVDQFKQFELGELKSLGGALNVGGDSGGYGRGGRGQWNIPGVDLNAPYYNYDWLEALLASLGQGGGL